MKSQKITESGAAKRVIAAAAAIMLCAGIVCLPAESIIRDPLAISVSAAVVDTADEIVTALGSSNCTLSADGSTITLTNDVSIAGMVFLDNGVNVTIDLNGHTWENSKNSGTDTSASHNVVIIMNDSSLTVKDSVGTGAINGVVRAGNDGYGSGTFTLESGTVRNIIVLLSSSLTINGGNVEPLADNYGFAISTNGLPAHSGTTIKINGGTVKGKEAGVYLPNGTLTQTGGTISGASGIIQRSGTLNITGGTVSGTGANVPPSYSAVTGDGASGSGNAVTVISSDYPAGGPFTNIAGGTMVSAQASAVGSFIDGRNVTDPNENKKGFITAGSFKDASGEAMDTALIADTAAAANVTTYGYTTTCVGQASISEAAQAGSTVEVIKAGEDLTVPEGVTVVNSTGSEIVVNGEAIPAGSSSESGSGEYKEVASVPATCKADGEKAHFESGSGKYIKNDDGSYTKVTDADLLLPKVTDGHTNANGETITFDANVGSGITMKVENASDAICDKGGSYDEVFTCDTCGETLKTVHKTTEALGHKPGEAKQENYVAASNTGKGSYDKVTYCTVCGAELSREKIYTDQLPGIITAPSSVKVSHTSAVQGTVVTVKSPVFDDIEVYSGNKLIARIYGSGTFVMPAGNVTVKDTGNYGAIMMATNAPNSYIYSYDSSMNKLRIDSSNKGRIKVKLGAEYAGKSVTLYSGKASTSEKLDEAVLDANGCAEFSVDNGRNYTLVVED